MMSRKDYLVLAKVFQRQRPMGGDPVQHQTYLAILQDLAETLKKDNLRFNIDKFLAECLRA